MVSDAGIVFQVRRNGTLYSGESLIAAGRASVARSTGAMSHQFIARVKKTRMDKIKLIGGLITMYMSGYMSGKNLLN